MIVPDPTTRRLWVVGRVLTLLLTAALLATLVARPGIGLTALWYVAIPLLPAVFFLNPQLWRGICPLATLNAWGNRLGTQRPLSPAVAGALSTGGLVLFHVLVPARRFLLNGNGPALAVTVVAVAGIAVALGRRYPVRSAFCNALCPVLPIELLYGQAPLVPLARGRCAACVVCTPRGCLDLAPARALTQVLGPSRRSAAWLVTPFGLFAAGLPGFVIGYGILQDGPITSAPAVYAMTLGASLASVIVVAVLVRGLRMPAGLAQLLIAGLAGIGYYWFAGPAVTRELGGGAPLAGSVRAIGIGLVTLWLGKATSGAGWKRRVG